MGGGIGSGIGKGVIGGHENGGGQGGITVGQVQGATTKTLTVLAALEKESGKRESKR